jgi:hypothetical protein
MAASRARDRQQRDARGSHQNLRVSSGQPAHGRRKHGPLSVHLGGPHTGFQARDTAGAAATAAVASGISAWLATPSRALIDQWCGPRSPSRGARRRTRCKSRRSSTPPRRRPSACFAFPVPSTVREGFLSFGKVPCLFCMPILKEETCPLQRAAELLSCGNRGRLCASFFLLLLIECFVGNAIRAYRWIVKRWVQTWKPGLGTNGVNVVSVQ